MKTYKKLFLGLALAASMAGLNACSDFDEINHGPADVLIEDVHPDYFFFVAQRALQQNPNDNERVFVYNWASIARVIGDNTFGAAARYSDEYNGCLYSFSCNSIKSATQAITIVNNNVEAGVYTNDRDRKYNENVREFSRIMRVVGVADFVDCFGPYAIEAFNGVNPTFNSVEEVYHWMLQELAEAQAAIALDVTPTSTEQKQDAAFKMDPAKWQKLANSLRLRLSMRLSEVDEAYAKAQFAAAASQPLMTEDVFEFQEYGGWSDWEGVYNRSWDDNVISSSMVNILSGLGDTKVVDCYADITGSTADIASHVKPMSYIGIEYKNHYPAKTDNPMNYQWLDGVPENVDPRAFYLYNLPNDATANTYSSGKAVQTVDNHAKRGMKNLDEDEYTYGMEDATLTFNGALAGVRPAWINEFTYTKNMLNYYSWDTCSFLATRYNDTNNKSKRIFMGCWETYFLLAEGALRGWANAGQDETYYNAGVTANFKYLGLGKYAEEYLASENYNRVGTSVKYTHTAEAADFEATYYDGYENVANPDEVLTGRGALKTKTYHYPKVENTLYAKTKGIAGVTKGMNDKLTKIITQKYIASVPYNVVEMWNDRRRLGLPFFEVPGADMVLSGSDYDNDKTNGYDPNTDWTGKQTYKMFTQRMRYPTSLKNADPAEYEHALQLLGGDNTMMVPLWWVGVK